MNAFTETIDRNHYTDYVRSSGIPPRAYFEKLTGGLGARLKSKKDIEPISNQERAWRRILHRRSLAEQASLWREVLIKQETIWHPEGFSDQQIADWKQFCVRTWSLMTVREKKFWIKEMPSRLDVEKQATKRPETLLTAPLRTANAELLRLGDTAGLGFGVMDAADKIGDLKSPRSRLPVTVRFAAAQAFNGEAAGVSGIRHTERKVSAGGVVAENQLGRNLSACEAGLGSAIEGERLRIFARIPSDPKLFSHTDDLILGQQLFLNESSGAVEPPRARDLVEEPRAGHPGWCVVRQGKRLYIWDVAEHGKKSLRGFYEGEIFYPHADQSFRVTTNSGEEILVDETQLNILRSVDGEVVIVPTGEQGMKTLHSPRAFGTTKPLNKNQAVWGDHGATHITLLSGRHFVNAAGDVFVYDKIIGLHHVGVLAS